MSNFVSNYRVSINAEPEQVFSYVADLTRHGEWSENLKVESVSENPIGVGSQYHSTGRMMGKQVENDVSCRRVRIANSPVPSPPALENKNFSKSSHLAPLMGARCWNAGHPLR